MENTSALKIEAGKLTPEVGKLYRTREGRKAGIDHLDGGPTFPILGWFERDGKKLQVSWTLKLANNASGRPHPYDIIAPWVDKPEVDWSKMPAWAVAVALDEAAKKWRWYSEKPIQRNTLWCPGGQDWLSGPIPPQYAPKWTGDWRDSLVLREGNV